MKISIIIPIYNVADKIEKCLLSVIDQNYHNIELVLVNDGTPDDSFKIAKNFLHAKQCNQNVVYIEHDHNKGLSAARNTGIDHATGDYIFFLDSDDSLTSHDSLKKMFQAINDQSSPDIIIGNYQCISKGTKIIGSYLQSMQYDNNKALFLDFTRKNIYWAAWGKLIKKEVISSANLRFRNKIYAEDALWSYFLFKACNSAVVIPDIVYDYHDTPGSIMNSINQKHIIDMITIAENIYQDFISKQTMYPTETILYMEKTRRLSLQYMFKYDDHGLLFTLGQIDRLKKITPPILITKKLLFIKQSILLRMPAIYIYKYLKRKWSKKSPVI